MRTTRRAGSLKPSCRRANLRRIPNANSNVSSDAYLELWCGEGCLISIRLRDKNLQRLAKAFDELEAGLATANDTGSWFPRHPVENWAQYDTLHLMTKHGPIDLVFAPDGAPRGYDDLVDATVELQVGDERVRVVTVARWEMLKEASGRGKDLAHLDQHRATKKHQN